MKKVRNIAKARPTMPRQISVTNCFAAISIEPPAIVGTETRDLHRERT